MSGLDRIIQKINNDYQQQEDTYLQKAHEEATVIKDKLIHERDERLEQREQQYIEDAKFLKQREISKFKMQADRELNDVWLEHINKVIDDVRLYFKSLSKEEFVAYINLALNKENGNNKPRIEVNSSYYQIVLEEFGRNYQVIVNDEMDAGFILTYDEYDINFEIDKVFKFNGQAYINRVRELLLEGNND